MQRIISHLNYYQPVTIFSIIFFIPNSLVLVLSNVLRFDIPLEGWIGLLMLEIAILFSGFIPFKKSDPSNLSKKPTVYKQHQDQFLQLLKEASYLHTRQAILDKMMSLDLLRGVHLSKTTLPNVHLESANLEGANLDHCDLTEADFKGANLEGALLTNAKLRNADLTNVNLRSAQLAYTQLEGATLVNANLTNADLQYACLQGSSLYDVELEGACLDRADLRGCCLLYANLSRATLNGAIFDETTILPNGEKWTITTDWRMFTDATHRQYTSYKRSDSSLFGAFASINH